MSLLHKTVTARALTANRANAHLSTGPRSEQGKKNATQHLIRHGTFAVLPKASMKELGESREEYEKQREALFESFAPEDGFEEMLVEDMAQLHWRWQRLMRAEAGLMASKKRQYEIGREIEKLRRESPVANALATGNIGTCGFLGLPDSVEKYEHMIRSLRELRALVATEGFVRKHRDYLELIYGKWGSLGGLDLKIEYDTSLKRAESSEPRDDAEDRASFVAAVDREIALFERLKELCRAKDWETTQAMKDAQLASPAEDLQMILLYESRLERQFRRKLRQLVAWRRAKRGVFAVGAKGARRLKASAEEAD